MPRTCFTDASMHKTFQHLQNLLATFNFHMYILGSGMMTVRYKTYDVFCSLYTGIVGSNLARGKDVVPSCVLLRWLRPCDGLIPQPWNHTAQGFRKPPQQRISRGFIPHTGRTTSRLALEPRSHLYSGYYGALALGVKQPERAPDHYLHNLCFK
jgi:hypothetical protein